MIDSLLRMFVLHHKGPAMLKPRRYLTQVDLNALKPFPYVPFGAMDNQMAEGRAFLAEGLEPDADYVGFASPRWSEKWPWAPPLDDFGFLERWLHPKVVLAPDVVADHWYDDSNRAHPGMWRVLEELYQVFDVRPTRRPTLYGNTFICTYQVYYDLLDFFRQAFTHFHKKYGFDLGYKLGPHDPARLPAYFYERVTMLFFSTRRDLVVQKFPTRDQLLNYPDTDPETLMAETSKAHARRVKEKWFERYIQPDKPGIDIGCGKDPLNEVFRRYDKEDGDANFMAGVPDQSFNTVYASHILEHLHDPGVALENWYRITKPHGLIIICVPHRDLYEKRTTLPSQWNGDHKTFWLPESHEQPHTRGLLQTVREALGDKVELVNWRTLDDGYVNTGPDKHAIGEFSIEVILRRKP